MNELDIMQLIQLVHKTNIHTEAISNGNLVTSISNATLHGYQQTFPEFVQSIKAEVKQKDCVD